MFLNRNWETFGSYFFEKVPRLSQTVSRISEAPSVSLILFAFCSSDGFHCFVLQFAESFLFQLKSVIEPLW